VSFSFEPLSSLTPAHSDLVLTLGEDSWVCDRPFDYSDQCTGRVRVERHGSDVVLQLGWSLHPGHDMPPPGEDWEAPTDWEPRKGSVAVRMSIAACAAAIDESQRRLAKK